MDPYGSVLYTNRERAGKGDGGTARKVDDLLFMHPAARGATHRSTAKTKRKQTMSANAATDTTPLPPGCAAGGSSSFVGSFRSV